MFFYEAGIGDVLICSRTGDIFIKILDDKFDIAYMKLGAVEIIDEDNDEYDFILNKTHLGSV